MLAMSIFGSRRPQGSRSGCNGRIIIALAIAAFSVISYVGYRSINPVTGEPQYVALSKDQEITLGLEAAGPMAAQFGGLERDSELQLKIDGIGQRIVSRSDAVKAPYDFRFRVLADTQTINAFALPGGQIFITRGLLDRMQTEGQIAGVLAHEIVHVTDRHGAEHIAKAELTQGLTAATVIATYDPNNPSTQSAAAMAALVGQLINLKYGRNDELESDRLGVKYMAQAGYDPRGMLRVMEVLAEASRGRGGAPPEFFSTHPNPDNRLEKIQQAIDELFPAPQGVPGNLEQ
jgi:beta-barrel assembly-enhancing protease